MRLCCFCTLALFAITLRISAQYGNHSQLGARIKALDQKVDIINASTLVTTHGGKEVILVTTGKGNPDSKPGIAVVGGIQGTSLASTEIIMQMMEKLSTHPSFTEEVTFYFFPDVSPDASEQYFAPIRYERNENARPGDDDRDGLTDEDGYDDLNQDGLITWMRIKDVEKGDYMIHPENPSVMVKSDIAKRQQGEYIVMYEGIDNDKDGRFNEDPPGGVIFNKNFSYNYPYHTIGAGENALSELETRALAKFLFDHWNIFAVLCIGSENNLSEYNDLKLDFADKNIPAVVHEKDKPYFESVVDLYKKNNRLNDSAKTAPSGGDFLSWDYFHYNRFSFSTPAWNVSKNKNNLGSQEFDYLTWASGSGLKDLVVAWQKTDHPDFPGKVVEIGGMKPCLMNNPPPAMLDTISDRHLDFLLALAAMHPALAFNEVKITKRSEDLFMLEVEITNSGKLPTMTAQAAGSKWLKKVRLDMNTSKSQQVVGGKKVFLFERIVPGETVKAAWLINGKGKISLKAGSPHTGFVNREIELN
jgi:hypothetical protein